MAPASLSWSPGHTPRVEGGPAPAPAGVVGEDPLVEAEPSDQTRGEEVEEGLPEVAFALCQKPNFLYTHQFYLTSVKHYLSHLFFL